jgi:thymidylate kinase
MKERPYYLHFEGMDLAGKTTATQNFIKSTGAEWNIRRNSLSRENPIHLLADSLRKAEAYDAEVLGNLYVAALMADIHSFQWPGKDTIQDSTIILRSIAFHTVRGTPRIREVLLDLLPEHPKFDASFVFTASIEKRLERLQRRIALAPQEVSEEDMMVIRKPEKFLAMEAVMVDMAKMAFHSVIVDTSTLTPDMVVGVIHQNFRFEK